MKTISHILLFLILSFLSQPVYSQERQVHDRTPLLDQFDKEIIQVNERTYVAVGFGASNSSMIIGKDSLIIIDCMLGTEAADDVLKAFREISDKPISTIIYTHGHTDHVGGASVFVDENNPRIIACDHSAPELDGYNKLDDILYQRATRQFGSFLTPEEKIAGIAPVYRPLGGRGEGKVKPNLKFTESLKLSISGVNFQLQSVPGETDDQLYVYLQDDDILFCGDNFYFSFPNVYAIRGTKYRDINQWIHSLNKLIDINAETLISGHARPIKGEKLVRETLTNYKAAMEFVLDETLEGMNKGLTPVQIASELVFPDSLASTPYLKEYYGVVDWTVRNIYNGYLGWFDGNPTNLFPLNPRDEAEKIVTLAGGTEKMLGNIQQAMADKEYQWACQLTDYLMILYPGNQNYKKVKAEALFKLADIQISSNARHYYLTVAKELTGEL